MEDFTKKDQVKRPHKTILGHPKHVLHLVLSPIAIAEAFNVMCVWVAVPHQYQISKKKILGHFSIRKNTKPGGGREGGCRGRFGKSPDFLFDLFCETFPKRYNFCYIFEKHTSH